MSLRARIFIIVSILVFLILGISIFLVVSNKNKNTQTQADTTKNNVAVTDGGQPGDQTSVGVKPPVGLPAKIATPLEAQKNGVVQLAKVFVERYGTYSTDNDWQNIKDVATFVTLSLWSKISAPMTVKSASQSFVGMTTKVISMDLTYWSDSKATVELKTTRAEEKNGIVTMRYQNATVELIKQNTVWLIDKISWN